MKTSNLFLATLKETPQDAELISHQLMLRAGLIRRLGSGLYSWLPLGLRILRKIEAIIREEMHSIGAQEILMPMVQPAELWHETGRWDKFGPQMLKLKDRHQRDFCLGPTHEEVVTHLMRAELASYKQLPINLFQIQTKFRDEIRPRFGVMRAREFLMKDAYSFHLDSACLHQTYQAMYQAYSQIFERLGLHFKAVLADTGAIGGSQSHEFHVLADSGEDTLVVSHDGSYAANLELAQARLPEDLAPVKALSHLQLAPSQDLLSHINNASPSPHHVIKTLFYKGSQAAHPIIGLLLSATDELNMTQLAHLPDIAQPPECVSLASLSQVPAAMQGPLELDIPVYADCHAMALKNVTLGSNQPSVMLLNVNWARDLPQARPHPLRLVREGDLCDSGTGPLSFRRGIEVGHIFQLGQTYTQALNLQVLNETGRSQLLEMGCYGIGVSRIVAASIEQNHDARGILWPKALAPYQVALVAINSQRNEALRSKAAALYEALLLEGIDVLWDDRSARPGVIFNDLDLIGIPHRIVLSERGLDAGMVEYKARSKDEAITLPLTELKSFLKDVL